LVKSITIIALLKMRYGGRIILYQDSVWCCAEQTWEWSHGIVDTRTANARRRLAFAWQL